jgi:hypothetical protein
MHLHRLSGMFFKVTSLALLLLVVAGCNKVGEPPKPASGAPYTSPGGTVLLAYESLPHYVQRATPAGRDTVTVSPAKPLRRDASTLARAAAAARGQ